jgi:hypothetical protein
VLDPHRLPLVPDSGGHFADGVHNVIGEAIFHDLPEGANLAVLSGGDKGGHLPCVARGLFRAPHRKSTPFIEKTWILKLQVFFFLSMGVREWKGRRIELP